MKKRVPPSIQAFIAVLAFAGLSLQSSMACSNYTPTSPVGIVPTGPEGFPGGDPVCGPFSGYRINSPESGITLLDLNNDGIDDVEINVISTDPCGETFTWTLLSNIYLEKVYVKGGPNQLIYDYSNLSPSTDGGLHAPLVGSNYADISHIDFCFGYRLTVTKTANATYTRTWHWTIDKVVSPGSWQLFVNDEGTSTYTVSVTKTGYTDSNFAASGTITVANTTPFAATITGVTDVVSPGIPATVSCGVSFPYVLPAGQSLGCSYTVSLPDATPRTNTATVTTNGSNGVKGSSGTAEVMFGAPTTVVNNSIDVNDSNGMSWSASNSTFWTYPTTFDCGDEGENTNIATIVQTGQSDDARVTVTCYDLLVRKTANTSYDRTWNWTIDKVADVANLTLMPGQGYEVNYLVTLTATSTDHNFEVEGMITIENNHPTRAALLTGVTDVMTGGIMGTVVCPTPFPLTVPANDQIQCTYSSALPNAMTRTNTATATQQNYSFNGGQTPNGTTDYSGTKEVVFSPTPTNESNKQRTITDEFNGQPAVTLGSVVAMTLPQHTFPPITYINYVGPFEDPADCGNQQVTNIVRIPGQFDTWTIDVYVPCEEGCTLTPGYWKTHSSYGPAPYDETWEEIGEDTDFFYSGKSYYQALWTPPAGNVYWILAHAYIAAELNQLNGADIPQNVLDAFEDAYEIFNNPVNTPAEVRTWKGGKRNNVINLATILDNYNNGIFGPGHCSEEEGNGTSGEQSYTTLMDETEEAILVTATPNPFAGEVQFTLSMPYDSPVTLEIFGANGQKIATLFSAYLEAGHDRTVTFDGMNLPQGIYTYRLTTDREVKSGQVVRTK